MLQELVKKEKVNIFGKNGVRLSLYTGFLEYGFADRWSTLHFYHAYPNDVLTLTDMNYEFAVATYSLDWEDQYMYTYCYEREENWSTYAHDLTPDSYSQKPYVFQKECYFRVNCRRLDGQILMEPEEKHIGESLEFSSEKVVYGVKDCFREEIEDTCVKLEKEEGKKFLLLTDSHYVINGTWEDTLQNMNAVASKINLDGLIHLGDITDGMISREVNLDYINYLMDGMEGLELPMDFAMGNHDSNYFYNNPDKFTEDEQYQYYFKNIHNQNKQLYYYRDDEDLMIRFIFLHSFDYREEVRYGFSDEEVSWFEKVLAQTPDEYRILVFSHVPPLPEIHFWSDKIRNGECMVSLAESHEETTGQKILAWIHGHNHADAVYRKRQFPIVAIGCNKYEYFLDKKPEGSFTPERKRNHASQDLWDVLCIQKDSDELHFIRFGAGEDRGV